MENDNKKIVGYIGIGIFLLLIFQKLYVIINDVTERILLVSDLEFTFVLIISKLIATLICLLLFYFSLKRIKKISNSDRISIKRTIIILFVIFITIIPIFSYLQGELAIWLINHFKLFEKSNNYNEYYNKNFFSETVISGSVWVFNLLVILFIIFSEMRSQKSK